MCESRADAAFRRIARKIDIWILPMVRAVAYIPKLDQVLTSTSLALHMSRSEYPYVSRLLARWNAALMHTQWTRRRTFFCPVSGLISLTTLYKLELWQPIWDESRIAPVRESVQLVR